MDWADGIADTSFNRFTAFFYSFYCGFNIAKIVESIEYPENINSHFHGLLDEPLHNVIRIMPITHRILTPQ